jgi:hypothetical protein
LAQSPALEDGLPLTVTRRGQFHIQLDWADASATGCWDSGAGFGPARVAVLDMTELNRGLETPMDLVVGYTLGSQANWAFDVPARRWARPVPVPG